MPHLDLIEPGQLPGGLRDLISAAPMPGLSAGPTCKQTVAAVENYIEEHPGRPLVACALWLLAGELDASHAISQSIDTSAGSYWHGIMHRREHDFSNAKYWFRRAGQHPLQSELATLVVADTESLRPLPCERLGDARTLSAELVDLCQSACSARSEWTEALEKICWWEWQLLFRTSSHPIV